MLYLRDEERDAFGAIWFPGKPRGVIVFNDGLDGAERSQAIAEEVSHRLAGHRPDAAFDGRGLRRWNGEQENEAKQIAAAILVSEKAAWQSVADGLSVAEAARRYGVTDTWMVSRLAVTGAADSAQWGGNLRLTA